MKYFIHRSHCGPKYHAKGIGFDHKTLKFKYEKTNIIRKYDKII